MVEWQQHRLLLCLFNISGELGTTATPGIYNVYFSANYSGVDPLPNTNRVDLTNTITLVAVTNVTASTNHIAAGTNKVTLTALMTPVDAGQWVTWAVTGGGGSVSPTTGLSVEFMPGSGGETVTITATAAPAPPRATSTSMPSPLNHHRKATVSCSVAAHIET